MTSSRRRLTSSARSASASVSGVTRRRSSRVRTWSAITRASRGSLLYSPPRVARRAVFTASPGTWTTSRPAARSMTSSRRAIPPSMSMPTCRLSPSPTNLVTCPISALIAAGVLSRRRLSTLTALPVCGSSRVATAQWLSFATSMPTATSISLPSPHSRMQLLPAVLALHSDGSQSLISSQKEAARQAAMRPEPSRTTALKAIPAPLAHRRPGRLDP